MATKSTINFEYASADDSSAVNREVLVPRPPGSQNQYLQQQRSGTPASRRNQQLLGPRPGSRYCGCQLQVRPSAVLFRQAGSRMTPSTSRRDVSATSRLRIRIQTRVHSVHTSSSSFRALSCKMSVSSSAARAVLRAGPQLKLACGSLKKIDA